MLHRELNSYADAGSDPAYDDPYTEDCRECEGTGKDLHTADWPMTKCSYCLGEGWIECERPSREDFAEEDVDQ